VKIRKRDFACWAPGLGRLFLKIGEKRRWEKFCRHRLLDGKESFIGGEGLGGMQWSCGLFQPGVGVQKNKEVETGRRQFFVLWCRKGGGIAQNEYGNKSLGTPAKSRSGGEWLTTPVELN